MTGRLVGGLVLILLAGGGVAVAGLPGYFEWILWEQTEGELQWVSGPYPKLLDCEKEGDRLAQVRVRSRPGAARYVAPGSLVVSGPSGTVRIRLLCVPDSVNPREDRRWR